MANSYIKTDWNEGDVLTAIGMNNIEVGIEMAHNVDEILEDRMDQIENDMDVLENMHENYAIDTNAEIDRLDDKDIELSDQITALDGRMDDVELEVDKWQIDLDAAEAKIVELEARINALNIVESKLNDLYTVRRCEVRAKRCRCTFTRCGNMVTFQFSSNYGSQISIHDILLTVPVGYRPNKGAYYTYYGSAQYDDGNTEGRYSIQLSDKNVTVRAKYGRYLNDIIGSYPCIDLMPTEDSQVSQLEY